MSQLCSTEPDAPPPDPVDGVGGASSLEITVNGAVKFATRPLKLVSMLPTTLSSVVETVNRARTGWRWRGRLPRRRPFNERHRPPQHRVRPTEPRGHQGGEEPLRRQGQRRGDGPGSGRAAEIPARPRRAAGEHAGRDGAGVGARQIGSAGPQPGFRHVLQAGDPHRRPNRTAQVHR